MKLLFVLMIAPSIVPAAEEEGSIPPPPKVATRQPTIASVFPMAAQPGQSVDFEVRGEFLDGCRQMAFETSDLSAKVTDASFTRVHGRLTVGREFRFRQAREIEHSAVAARDRW